MPKPVQASERRGIDERSLEPYRDVFVDIDIADLQ